MAEAGKEETIKEPQKDVRLACKKCNRKANQRMKNKVEKTSERIKEVYDWASLLAVENRDRDWLKYYYWTEPAKLLLLRLRNTKRGLIALIGLQGTGKTTTLMAIGATLYKEGFRTGMIRWTSEITSKKVENERYMFLDLPDYATGSSRLMKKHLNEISKIWYELKDRDIVFVIAAQKELFKGHSLIGKMDIIELTPLKSQQLLEAYKTRFDTTDPFPEEALLLIAELSRGVFRRFLRYIKLCLEEILLSKAKNIDIDLVKKTITIEQLEADMDLELSEILADKEKKILAVKILNLIREKGEINQKTIAKQLEIHESTLGRILDKLETHNYIKREKGAKKERIVRLI
jgi:hypothetical protein